MILVSRFLETLGRKGFASGKLCQKWLVKVEGLDLRQRVKCPDRKIAQTSALDWCTRTSAVITPRSGTVLSVH